MNRIERIKKLRENRKHKRPLNGEHGIEGEIGPMGPIGPRGIAGVPGLKGEQGIGGSPGRTGLKGSRGLTGTKGDKGDKGIIYRGQWKVGISYKQDDVIINYGSAFICLQTHTARRLSEPTTGEKWKTFWAILAERGETGPGGAPGIQGIPGINGNSSLFITEGSDGITYFRMQSPDDSSLWDLYIDSTGAWVSVAVAPPSGGGVMIATGPLFGLTYAS